MNKIEKTFLKLQFSTDIRLKLYQKFASFLTQGSPLYDTLNVLATKFEENKKGDIRAAVLREWVHEMDAGKEFSTAISDWVPPAEMMLIQAGERSGAMVDAINNAIEVTTAAKRMKKTIMSALSYPFFLIIVLFLMVYLFSVQVVPKLTGIKDPSTWPGPAKTMYEVSQVVENYWMVFIIVFAAIVVSINLTIPRHQGAIRDKILDKIPPWTIYKSFQASVFLISIAALMKTGTALADALESLRKDSSPYVRRHISKMIRNMNLGKANGVSLNDGLLPKEIGMDIEIYDETADFQNAMEEVGKNSIEDGIESITKSSKTMGSIVMMGVAGYIGWIYYSFYTLTSSIAQ